MVPSLLVTLVCLFVMNEKGAPGGDGGGPRLSKPTLLFFFVSKFYYFVAVIYSVFLPIHLGTMWFYIGIPITLIGLAGSLVVLVSWATTPAGEPVTKGIYRYSRNPMYVTAFLLEFGISIASVSWLFFLFSIIGIVGAVYFIKMEEAFTLGHFGAAYREYMDRTPRWIGIPKSEKQS